MRMQKAEATVGLLPLLAAPLSVLAVASSCVPLAAMILGSCCPLLFLEATFSKAFANEER